VSETQGEEKRGVKIPISYVFSKGKKFGPYLSVKERKGKTRAEICLLLQLRMPSGKNPTARLFGGEKKKRTGGKRKVLFSSRKKKTHGEKGGIFKSNYTIR